MERAGSGAEGNRFQREEDLLRRVQSLLHRPEPHVVTGIGDDCAVLALPGAVDHLLVSTDLLLEHIHFELHQQTFQQLGYKALAVNLSDLAAMGADPLAVFVSLCLPRRCAASDIEALYTGMEELARSVGASIVGGDTSASADSLMLSLTVLGLAPPAAVVRRSGAQPGDRLFVTGTLGDAAAGLEFLQRQDTEPPASANPAAAASGPPAGFPEAVVRQLAQRYRLPRPRLSEGRWLARGGFASAMLDLSDGLSTDLHRLCEASRVGARLVLQDLPRSTALEAAAAFLQHGTEHYTLHGGEDYELLAAVPAERRETLLAQWPFRDTLLMEIGWVVPPQQGVKLITLAEREEVLPPGGFDHFAPG